MKIIFIDDALAQLESTTNNPEYQSQPEALGAEAIALVQFLSTRIGDFLAQEKQNSSPSNPIPLSLIPFIHALALVNDWLEDKWPTHPHLPKGNPPN